MCYFNPLAGLKTEDDMTTESQFRNCVTGRMAKSNQLAHPLIDELSKKAA
jgi:hypothetical protein